MANNGEFQTIIDGVKMNVAFEMSGPLGHGDDCQLESMSVFIGDEEVTDVLSNSILDKLERRCWENLPDAGPDCMDRDDD